MMKFIDRHCSINHSFQSAGFRVRSLMLLAFITFSGAVSLVSAQTTPEVCRQTKAVLEQYEREKDEVTNTQYFKEHLDDFRTYLSELNNAINNGRLVNIRTIESLAFDLKIDLAKDPVRMSPDERSAFQRQARPRLVQRIQEISNLTTEELVEKLGRIMEQLKVRRERYKALSCDEVLSRKEVTIPNTINECEEYGGSVCGTWTLKDNQFHAVWSNGAKAILTIKQFDNNQILITRDDTDDSFSRTFSATYTGTISGNRITGKVTWNDGRKTWSGTWSASW